MPVISCGGMRYQHQWQDLPLEEIPKENQDNLEATIRRAVSLGINHIETARGYGCSERQLGVVLPTFPRDEIIVQTKIGPKEDAEEFRSDFMDSFARLNLDYVDLLGLHGINTPEILEWCVRPGGCLDVARDLQKQGLVRHVGFSTHGSCEVIEAAINTEAFGGFDYVNLHWYYIYQRNWDAVLSANKQDMGVFIISPSDKGGLLYKPSDKLVELTQPLHPIVFNDLFCLMHPEIHTLSVGAARPSDFDEHVEAVGRLAEARELVGPVCERLEAEMLAVHGESLQGHFAGALPEWEKVPGDVNIKMIKWLWKMAKAWDLVEYGKMRYNLLGNGGHWFPGRNLSVFEEQPEVEGELEKLSGSDEFMDVLREAHELMFTAPVERLSNDE